MKRLRADLVRAGDENVARRLRKKLLHRCETRVGGGAAVVARERKAAAHRNRERRSLRTDGKQHGSVERRDHRETRCRVHRGELVGDASAPTCAGSRFGNRALPLRLLVGVGVEGLGPNACSVLRLGDGLHERPDVAENRKLALREQRLHLRHRGVKTEGCADVHRLDRQE